MGAMVKGNIYRSYGPTRRQKPGTPVVVFRAACKLSTATNETPRNSQSLCKRKRGLQKSRMSGVEAVDWREPTSRSWQTSK